MSFGCARRFPLPGHARWLLDWILFECGTEFVGGRLNNLDLQHILHHFSLCRTTCICVKYHVLSGCTKSSFHGGYTI